MADTTGSTAPKIDSNIESGRMEHNEKSEYTTEHKTEKTAVANEDEEEDEDMDALIDELESQDGAVEEEEEEQDNTTEMPVPDGKSIGPRHCHRVLIAVTRNLEYGYSPGFNRTRGHPTKKKVRSQSDEARKREPGS